MGVLLSGRGDSGAPYRKFVSYFFEICLLLSPLCVYTGATTSKAENNRKGVRIMWLTTLANQAAANGAVVCMVIVAAMAAAAVMLTRKAR